MVLLCGDGVVNYHKSCAADVLSRENAGGPSQNEVYYVSIKRERKIRGINKCRCDERLQTKTKEFTRLLYTGLVLELEHRKIETRLISERFANAMGECEN